MKLQGIQLGLASPKMSRLWAERKLVKGKVRGPIINPQTLNYQRPHLHKNGLLCVFLWD